MMNAREKAKDLFSRVNGGEDGFEAAFSPGAQVEDMSGLELMERLQISEPFNVDQKVKEPGSYLDSLIADHQEMERNTLIEVVNNGEFERCTEKLMECFDNEDKSFPERTPALVLERCRRGGKTFMLSAVAKKLAEQLKKQSRSRPIYIVLISLNTDTNYKPGETAVGAILARIAYFLSDSQEEFDVFRKAYSGFNSVKQWLEASDVILLIDELNVIPNTAIGYDDMSETLDSHLRRKGGALLYSTHHRIEQDLLRGRTVGLSSASRLSLRKHIWMAIPRIERKEGLVHKNNFKFGFWSAVLRGRIPALITLDAFHTWHYAPEDEVMFQERQHALGAVLSGDATNLQSGRDVFRSYCYRRGPEDRLLLWPPFLIAQTPVLGKDCAALRDTLEHPQINEAKAFEALVQLSVIVRLLAGDNHHHTYVPRHKSVTDSSCFDATAILHVHASNENIPSLVRAVEEEFSSSSLVRQVVAVPLYDQFPKYDFFLLHRRKDRRFRKEWHIRVGYQCKFTRSYPDKEHSAATRWVEESIWVEGDCPESRTKPGKTHGWRLMDKAELGKFLGASFYHALPTAVDGDEDDEPGDADSS